VLRGCSGQAGLDRNSHDLIAFLRAQADSFAVAENLILAGQMLFAMTSSPAARGWRSHGRMAVLLRLALCRSKAVAPGRDIIVKPLGSWSSDHVTAVPPDSTIAVRSNCVAAS
jgi:hypothetical protein